MFNITVIANDKIVFMGAYDTLKAANAAANRQLAKFDKAGIPALAKVA